MEMIIYKEDETIDARDLFPPLPLLSIKNRIDKLQTGNILKTLLNLLNFPEAESEIMVWAKTLGHSVLEIERKENEIIFFIEKGRKSENKICQRQKRSLK